MALIDVFKKKKKPEEKPIVEKPKAKAKPEPVKKEPPKKEKKAVSSQAGQALKSPHVTEKASDGAKLDQYIFKVWPGADKKKIKKAVEDVYGVEVVSARVINVPPKKRRLGRVEGWRKGYKKAIVRIKEGQKIEVLPR